MALDPITAVLNIGGQLIEHFFPDPSKAAEAKLELMKLAQAGELEAMKAAVQLDVGQMEINKVEAANPSLLVSGGRPAAVWLCVLGLAVDVLQPFFSWVCTVAGWPQPPTLPTDALMPLLYGLLGLGGYRTLEKIKGVARQ